MKSGTKMFSCCGDTIWNVILDEIDPNFSIGIFKKVFGNYFTFQAMMYYKIGMWMYYHCPKLLFVLGYEYACTDDDSGVIFL